MQLRDYLELKGQEVSDFAAEYRGSFEPDARQDTLFVRIWRHINGKRRPDPESVERYKALTKGAVTAQDWIDLAVSGRSEDEAA